MDVRDAEAGELLAALLAELRALREESARQTALLEAMLRKLGEIERTQYS
jgi:transposase